MERGKRDGERHVFRGSRHVFRVGECAPGGGQLECLHPAARDGERHGDHRALSGHRAGWRDMARATTERRQKRRRNGRHYRRYRAYNSAFRLRTIHGRSGRQKDRAAVWRCGMDGDGRPSGEAQRTAIYRGPCGNGAIWAQRAQALRILPKWRHHRRECAFAEDMGNAENLQFAARNGGLRGARPIPAGLCGCADAAT